MDEPNTSPPYGSGLAGRFSSARTEILSRFRDGKLSGKDCARALSRAMDEALHELASGLFPPDCGLCIVATGGYGRAELCPYSDIDIMILLPDSAACGDPSPLMAPAQDFLYALWDSGLKIGHAVRTISECVAFSESDLVVLTTLLDSRLVWGHAQTFQVLQSVLHPAQEQARLSYVRQKLAERDMRHMRMGESRYVLEPHIKEGKGGLRDYQTLFWITDVLQGLRTPADLAQAGLITRAESRRFERAHDFLLTVRAHMHDLAGRAEERLHFDLQPALAQRLGYTDRRQGKAVERFMKHYFLFTRDTGDLTRIVCSAIEAQCEEGQAQDVDFYGFRLIHGRLNFPPDIDLAENPLWMIRLFRMSQDSRRDVHPFAIRAITRHVRAIAKIRQCPDANRMFMDILTDRRAAAGTLRRLNECGILTQFLPDFGRIVALMQFDRYHVFTVDEHSLRVIDILHRIESGEKKTGRALPERIFSRIGDRRALYVAALLHDICKGRGGDHSLLGAELALGLCPRLGLDDRETRLVSWLIFDHLLMSRTAFKRDLEDPKTIEDFTFRVYDPARLDLLTVLTCADIMGVGPDRWSPWKASLLESLYEKTQKALKGQKDDTIHEENTVNISRNKEYDQKISIEILPAPTLQATEVRIHCPDHAGLFATLSGALSAAGANIIEARIDTHQDGKAIDKFIVQNLSGLPFEGARRTEDMRQMIMDALGGVVDLHALIQSRAVPESRRDQIFDIPPRVRFSGTASRTDTVIEIATRDRHGLLYDVTCILRDQGLQIRSAKITTLGLKAVDVFYVQTQDGQKIDPSDYDTIRAPLLKAISPDR